MIKCRITFLRLTKIDFYLLNTFPYSKKKMYLVIRILRTTLEQRRVTTF